VYDCKGRYVLHRITPEEAQYKLCRVVQKSRAKKATIGRNPYQTGQAAAIPYIVTHDGRTIRYPDPMIQVNDTVKFDLKTGKVTSHIKFEVGNLAMVTRGANIGRIGSVVNKERHPGSFDIVHLRDTKGNDFATRIANVFIIGEGTKPWISLPKEKGVKLTVLEERQAKSVAQVERAVKKVKAQQKAHQTHQ